MSLGPSEIIIVLLVALLVLGPDKLPQAARTLGKYVSEFRKFSAAVQSHVDEALKMPDIKPSTSTERSEKDEAEAQPKPANPDTTGFDFIDERQPRAPRPPEEMQ